jgi:hypothetical protein
MRTLLPDDNAEKSVITLRSRGAYRYQTGTAYCCSGCSQLGSDLSQNRTMNDPEIGPMLEEAESGRHPIRRDNASQSEITKPNGNRSLSGMAYYIATGNPPMAE